MLHVNATQKTIVILILAIIFTTGTIQANDKVSAPEEAWSKTFGGTDSDWACSVQQTRDGGYILAGTTESYGAGWNDFWLVKVRGPEQKALSAISKAKSAIASADQIGADTMNAQNLFK